MSILESIRQKFQTEQKTAAAKRQAEWTEYRKLLSRVDGLKRGDEQRLEELVRMLEIDPAHIEFHPAILAEYERLQARQKDQPKVEADYKAILEKEGDLHRQMGVLGDQIKALYPERDRLLNLIMYCQHDLPPQLDLLRRWFGNLLGVAGGKPIGKAGAELPRCLADNPELRRQLGITTDGRFITPEDIAQEVKEKQGRLHDLRKILEEDTRSLEGWTQSRNRAEAQVKYLESEGLGGVADAKKEHREATFQIENLTEHMNRLTAQIQEVEKEVAACN